MSGRAPPRERELTTALADDLRRQGWRTYVDPDGTDYFDLAVRRGEEVGLIEGKVGAPRAVVLQALRRRPWADWVAVVVASERSADRIVARTAGRRAEIVGVWSVVGGRVRQHRAGASTHPVASADPFAPTRGRLRRALDDLDRGELPARVPWDDLSGAVGRASGGRRFREWRLDELSPSQD